jgi:hypothetical protein
MHLHMCLSRVFLIHADRGIYANGGWANLSHPCFPQSISNREDDTTAAFSLVLDGPLVPILNLPGTPCFVSGSVGALNSAQSLNAHLRQVFGGPDPPPIKNWSNGQYNFASHCAMLRMEISQMTRAVASVGGSPLLQQGGAGLQSSGRAFVLKMGFSPGISRCPALKRRIRVEAFPGALKRSFPRMNAGAPTNLLGCSLCFSNRNKVRIEIAVTYSKQTRGTNSNRNSFRGSSERRGNYCRTQFEGFSMNWKSYRCSSVPGQSTLVTRALPANGCPSLARNTLMIASTSSDAGQPQRKAVEPTFSVGGWPSLCQPCLPS